MGESTSQPRKNSTRGDHKSVLGLARAIPLRYIGLSFLILFGAWFVLSWVNEVTTGVRAIPSPIDTLASLGYLVTQGVDRVTLFEHVGMSFGRVLLGFLYAFLVAVPVGMLYGLNRKVRAVLSPIVEVLRPIPPIAWIPVAVILFGLGTVSYAFIIFIGAFFPLLQNVADGVKSTRPVYRDVAVSLGATRSQVLWTVYLPHIVPHIVTGVKVAIGIGWMCVVAAEMLGVSYAGIGYFIIYMKNIGNYAYMFASMLVLGLVGLGINLFFRLLEKKTLKWVEGTN